MRRDGIRTGERDAVAMRSLERIAATLGLDVGAFFAPEPDGVRPARASAEQDAALLEAFGRITDPQARERLIAAAEREAGGDRS